MSSNAFTSDVSEGAVTSLIKLGTEQIKVYINKFINKDLLFIGKEEIIKLAKEQKKTEEWLIFNNYVSDKKIIRNLNLKLEKNKIYVLMGPNGSGKSSLAMSIAGHPLYLIKKGKIIFNEKNITKASPDERSQSGIFLSFQSPLSLSGVSIYSLLRTAIAGRKDPLALREEIEKTAKLLKIKKELLDRSLNEGASGGERKKIELLQAAILDPKFIIFDEIDTGVDIDALKTIAQFREKNKKGKT